MLTKQGLINEFEEKLGRKLKENELKLIDWMIDNHNQSQPSSA